MDIDSLNILLNNPKYQLIFMLLTIWSLAWKGFALWRSVKNNQRNWFIAILILNTFGILEIIYLFYFSKPKINDNRNSF
jgi:hypothetical protein